MGVAIVRILRVTAAGYGIAALATALDQRTGPLSNFFSYFTIESNVLAVVLLLVGGLVAPGSTGWAYFRGAVTLYMTITGIVYATLLSDIPVGLTSAWINTALHRVLPLLLLADWVFFPPWPRMSYRAALGWLAFPLAYLAYSLIRGPFADFYPYPFLDPRPHGYDHVITYAIVLAVGMAALALIVRWIASARSAAQPSGASTMSKRT